MNKTSEDYTILAFDPGTHMGWAVWRGHQIIASGTEHFKEKDMGARFAQAQQFFSKMIDIYGPDLCVYEDVKRWMSAQAARIYGGLTGHLLTEAHHASVPIASYAPTQIKKFATGSGKASKEEMMECCRNATGIIPADDNEADAIWLAKLAVHLMYKH